MKFQCNDCGNTWERELLATIPMSWPVCPKCGSHNVVEVAYSGVNAQ